MYVCTCLAFVRINIQNYKSEKMAACSTPDSQSRSAEANIAVFGMEWVRI